ncbi:Melanoma-associated antigen D2 [Mortierella sp. 14UC]|nr:Melanoma-associated antigen D2 [Mortierella sp. 14UC]
MSDRRRKIVIDDEDDYGSRGSSQRSNGKRGAPSSTQGSGSQKRVMRDDDDDGDQDDYAPATVRQTTVGSKTLDILPTDFERFVKDVVRLAIFSSHSEAATIKRDDIKALLGNHTKLCDPVFDKAQERLRNVFGMEMAELTTRGRSGKNDEKGTKTYILRSVLPLELLGNEAVDWDDQLEEQGLLMVILSFIMVREGVIYESHLKQHFRRLMLMDESSDIDIEKKMDMFVKKRYLEKSKMEHMDDTGDKVEMEVRWGARAKAEIPEENVVRFIEEIFGPDAPNTLRDSILKASNIKAPGKGSRDDANGAPSSSNGSKLDSFLESGCSSELWRLRLGQSASWNLSSAVWEAVPLREDTTALPPIAGLGLKTLGIPGNQTESFVNGTATIVKSISPFMIEFGRGGCQDQNEKEDAAAIAAGSTWTPWIGFNIYNPVMNNWESRDMMNDTAIDLGINLTETFAVGNWVSPTVAIDYISFAWYIILQSTAPLRQVILRKDLVSMTEFMSKVDLTESSSTMFPTDLLFEGWNVTSVLNEQAPFVDKGVATVAGDSIVVLTGTANSFTPGDAQISQLRGCDHAYVYSTTKHTWARQELTVADDGALPDTREKAAFLTVGKTIYMYGGVKPYQTVLKDFWTLDTETWTWHRGPDGPGPRADHTLLQYYEYILVVSGFDVSRNVPLTNTLPLMVFDTNSTSWTNVIRPTLDEETTYVSNVTRAAIIIGTVTFAVVLMVIALSTHLLRKWNQRNYTKVYENVELEDQRIRATQELPSILKKRYLSEGGPPQGTKRSGQGVGVQQEVLFEDEDGGYSDDDGSFDGDDEYEDEHYQGGQKISLLSRSQPNPRSKSLQDSQQQQQQQGLAPPPQREQRRVRIQELVEEVEDDASEYSTPGDEEEDDDDGSAVIVRLPLDLSEREE